MQVFVWCGARSATAYKLTHSLLQAFFATEMDLKGDRNRTLICITNPVFSGSTYISLHQTASLLRNRKLWERNSTHLLSSNSFHVCSSLQTLTQHKSMTSCCVPTGLGKHDQRFWLVSQLTPRVRGSTETSKDSGISFICFKKQWATAEAWTAITVKDPRAVRCEKPEERLLPLSSPSYSCGKNLAKKLQASWRGTWKIWRKFYRDSWAKSKRTTLLEDSASCYSRWLHYSRILRCWVCWFVPALFFTIISCKQVWNDLNGSSSFHEKALC